MGGSSNALPNKASCTDPTYLQRIAIRENRIVCVAVAGWGYTDDPGIRLNDIRAPYIGHLHALFFGCCGRRQPGWAGGSTHGGNASQAGVDGRFTAKPAAGARVSQGSDAGTPSADFVSLRPDHVVGRYRIVSVLGQGSFGITYRAVDTELGREVAIKEYLP